jgi:hypothetical protein
MKSRRLKISDEEKREKLLHVVLGPMIHLGFLLFISVYFMSVVERVIHHVQTNQCVVLLAFNGLLSPST